jgi:hypothetical protein
MNKKGDSGTVGEELLANISELEEKCRVIKQASNEKYFSLEEALVLYGVSNEAYKNWMIKDNV